MAAYGRIFSLGLILWLWVSFAPPTWGHGTLHEQLDRLAHSIEREPYRADLRVRRAGLYCDHGQYDLAIADCEAAEGLRAPPPTLAWVRARCLFLRGDLQESLEELDHFLREVPGHRDGYALRARVLEKLAEPAMAAKAWADAIRAANPPKPNYFLQRARVLAQLPDGEVAALRCLEEGMESLGRLPVFLQAAVNIEVKLHRYEAAMARLDILAEMTGRPEPWIIRRAEILLEAGRFDEAEADFRRALEHLKRRPVHALAAPAAKELNHRVVRGLALVRAAIRSKESDHAKSVQVGLSPHEITH